MPMYNNLHGEEYSEALREALRLRRNRTITPAIDDALGNILYSISQWAIADSVKAGRLWRTMSQNEDFQADVLVAVVSYCDQVDLNRQPKEILTYLYKVANSRIRDLIIRSNRKKHKHEDVPIDFAVEIADFYGNRAGLMVAQDYDLITEESICRTHKK